MEVETINKVMWSIPNVLCLVGSRSGEEWNGMTQSWVTQVSMEPVLVAISVDNTAVTHRLIAESGAFTVNLWDRTDTRPFVKFSKPATFEAGALNGQPVRPGGVTGAPIFENAIAFVECTVWGSTDVGTHTVFYGEVVDAGFHGAGEEAEVARMEDTRMKYGGVRRH
jgi:flavin reductase (DIM6/NTAB) family NADH-FMN oxidoreductase RutF